MSTAQTMTSPLHQTNPPGITPPTMSQVAPTMSQVAPTMSQVAPTMEDQRHDAEVRYIAAMVGSHRRRAYLDGIEVARGKQAADRLRADLITLFDQRRCYIAGQLQTLTPNEIDARRFIVSSPSERAGGCTPGSGSFPGQIVGGNSNRIESVGSGGST